MPETTSPATTTPRTALPPDDALRTVLHDEVHARPSARIRMPALVVYVAVLNADVSREDEWAHLNALDRLPDAPALQLEELAQNFLRLHLPQATLRWERHSEFTRYMLIQSLPQSTLEAGANGHWLDDLAIDPAWLAGIPGKTVAAVQLVMADGDVSDESATMARALGWFGGRTVVASVMGRGHSLAVTDFHLHDDGYERMLVIAQQGTGPTRAGRIAQRLLELETYRLMALRGLPVAKELGPVLAECEAGLSDVTLKMETSDSSEAELLDVLIHVAARVEHATAQHGYRFSATAAYDGLVRQRIAELRELPVQGTQTIGEFMQRRLSPAIATVAASERRLSSLSQRIARTSALLRTRVDIATEIQNQQLLAKLTRGQALQLKLQATVEGLSIAAISYYVVSLLLYGAKSLKAAGLPVNPEVAAGALIPFVLFGTWRISRRIHAKLR